MKTLVLFNSKGGVGKTTLVYHLGHMLARLGHRTLAVDLDPQANLTSMFSMRIVSKRYGSMGKRACSRAFSPGSVVPAISFPLQQSR